MEADNLALARRMIARLRFVDASAKLCAQEMLEKAAEPSVLVIQYVGANPKPSDDLLSREMGRAIEYEKLSHYDVVIYDVNVSPGPQPSGAVTAKLVSRSEAIRLKLGVEKELRAMPPLAFVASSRIGGVSAPQQANIPFALGRH